MKKPYIDQEIKIGDDGWFFDLVVFKTRKQMLSYRKKVLFDTVNDPECMGAFHALTVESFGDNGTSTIKKTLGQMVLNYDDVSFMVVCHEALHAAMACMRRIEKNVTFGEEIDDNEEKLAYYTGDIAKCVLEGVAIRLDG